MNQLLHVHYENKPAYDIMLEPDFNGLSAAMEGLDMAGRRFMIITDSNVGKRYAEEVSRQLSAIAASVRIHTFPAGEEQKNLDTVNTCYEELIRAGFDRKDVLVALGGGVVGDLTGFAAATYLRGIRFIQVPTSLLSMVDSSIGGKTGVDYKAYKNMIGAFYQPKLVYMNLSVLSTLSDAQYCSGMGEIIKHGLIKDLEYYQWLKINADKILCKDYDILRDMIYRSCDIKRIVVETDPKEQGDRALLNFGHTIGHSVEKLMNFTLLHGECVCVGMAAAAYISMKRGGLSAAEYEDVLTTIRLFCQPISIHGIEAEEIYEVTRLDKKMDSDKIRFILLQGIGNSIIDSTLSREEMLEAIRTILK